MCFYYKNEGDKSKIQQKHNFSVQWVVSIAKGNRMTKGIHSNDKSKTHLHNRKYVLLCFQPRVIWKYN